MDRELIAHAASEVDQAGLTMRAVAERLGVGVTSLYYHVKDRADLAQLAAEYSAARIAVPVDRDQHWSLWLTEWAEYTRQAFGAHPVIFEQFLTGALDLDQMLPHIDAVVGHMERHGFAPQEALGAYSLISACAIGAAVKDLRANYVSWHGQSSETRFRSLLHDRQAGSFPHLAKVDLEVSAMSFQDQIYVTLVGIAVLRGEGAEAVVRPNT
jgi:AcrR family transcriptional regulator